jgi:chorismate mutase
VEQPRDVLQARQFASDDGLQDSEHRPQATTLPQRSRPPVRRTLDFEGTSVGPRLHKHRSLVKELAERIVALAKRRNELSMRCAGVTREAGDVMSSEERTRHRTTRPISLFSHQLADCSVQHSDLQRSVRHPSTSRRWPVLGHLQPPVHITKHF